MSCEASTDELSEDPGFVRALNSGALDAARYWRQKTEHFLNHNPSDRKLMNFAEHTLSSINKILTKAGEVYKDNESKPEEVKKSFMLHVDFEVKEIRAMLRL